MVEVKETLNLLNLPSNPYTYVNHARLRANVPFDASFFKWFLLGLNKKRYRFVFHLLESYPFHPPFLSFFLAPSSIPKVCKRLLRRSFQSTSRRVLSPIEIFDSTRKRGGKGSSIEFRGESIDPKGNDQKAISPRWRARDTLDAKTITSKGWEDHPRVFGFESTSAANCLRRIESAKSVARDAGFSRGEN